MAPCERSCHNEYTCAISRSRGQKLWYHVKGLVTMNTHVQYESPMSSGKKVMAKVKFLRIWSILLIKSDLKWCIHLSRSFSIYFSKVGQTSKSRS